MDYTLETAFCQNESRKFIFEIEDKVLNFLTTEEGSLFVVFYLQEKLLLDDLNSYQRMLVHLICEHYHLQSRSVEEKGNKDRGPEGIVSDFRS